MIQIGLKLSMGSFDCNLLQKQFSVREYLHKYVLRFRGLTATTSEVTAKVLFPLICQLEIFALNNTTAGMAKVCAADDLEFPFFGENPQVELLDDLSSQFQNPYHDQIGMYSAEREYQNTYGGVHLGGFDLNHATNTSMNYHHPAGMDEYSLSVLYSSHESLSLSSSMQHPMMARDLSSKQQYPFVQIQNHLSYKRLYDPYPLEPFYAVNAQQMHSSHNSAQTSATGVNIMNHQNFSGSKQSAVSDSFSCGSSVESFDSPLDEIFVKTSYGEGSGVDLTENRSNKRKTNSPGFFGESPEETLSYNHQMDTKRIKRESLTSNSSSRSVSLSSPVDPHCSKQLSLKIKDESEPARFVCHHCSSEFRVRSYLTRHLRKHNNAMAFVCPFYQDGEVEDDYVCGGKSGAKCHPTGGFSRKDTFKTHLKALHFIYPPRTRSRERAALGGRCAGCFEFFESNVSWFKDHIEPKLCPGFVNKRVTSAVKLEMD